MSTRLRAALLAGRAAATLSRRLGRGGGTVIAGHIVPRIAPTALRDITARLPMGSVVVSGTNGKTTTTRLVSHILRGAGYTAVHNRAGANLLTGLFTAVTQNANWRGHPRADVGIFEVDEATVPAALQHVQSRVLLLHNIFRDQLDRYGEVHFVAGLWQKAVAQLPKGTCLVVNADDPQVAQMVEVNSAGTPLMYGVEDAAVATASLPHAADARLCPRCGAGLKYDRVYYGHLGGYHCARCSFRRQRPAVSATAVELLGDEGSRVTFSTPEGAIRAHIHLPGLYNVYNALAATAVCHALGVPRERIARGLETFKAAFGRLERIEVEDRRLFLALVKNPVGFTEVLRTVLAGPGHRTLLLAINDLFADGTDVSWLWDVEFEQLQGRLNVAVCSGLRAEDMAVRLKYAGVETDRIRVETDLRRALELVLAVSEPGETVFVLPTYTAMLGVRDVLRQTGYVKGFWED
jgi:lipid II isoglutaminyl synthase (glutamine-hydrolysing)